MEICDEVPLLRNMAARKYDIFKSKGGIIIIIM